MPGPFIHMSSMQHAGARLARKGFVPRRSERINPTWTGEDVTQLGQLMAEKQNYGGPFRLHWQRHHLVENHMDAFWYLNDSLAPKMGDNYPQLTESALYFDIAFDEEGYSYDIRVRRDELPFRREKKLSSREMAIERLFNHDLIGVNLGWVAGANMPRRHAKNAFPVDFDVTGFDRRSQAGLE